MKRRLFTEQLLQGNTEASVADEALQWIEDASNEVERQRAWSRISQHVLTTRHDFVLHLALYRRCFQECASYDRPVWLPAQDLIESSNIGRALSELGFSDYGQLYQWSVNQRQEFWGYVLKLLGIHFDRKCTAVVDDCSSTTPRWLVGSRLNIVESCFAQASDRDVAIIANSAGDHAELDEMTYGELRELAGRVANGLIERGTEPGEAIGVVMPLTPQSVAVYLGIIAAGGVVVSVADSFAAEEIAVRFRIADVKRVFTQDATRWGSKQIPIYDKITSADGPSAIVFASDQGSPPKLRQGDIDFAEFLSDDPRLRCVPCDPQDPINVLFSSGTTAEPKAIPWDHTTPIKCASDAYFHHNLQPGDVTCWPTSLGWMMGPWLIFASLINRCTMALYLQAPTDDRFGRFVQDANVTMLGLVPSLVRTWRGRDCMRQFDWTAIKAFSSTGECSNPEDMFYLMHLAGYRPVIEYCGGTEIGGGYVTSTVVQPSILSAFSTPALGTEFQLIGEDGKPTDEGEVYLDGVSMGLSNRLLNRDHDQVYFRGNPLGRHGIPLRRHGDELRRLDNGYYQVDGRSDDTMNLGGIKVGCAELERVVNRLPCIVESAAVAARAEHGGPSRLVVFLVPARDSDHTSDEWKSMLQEAIRTQLNPLFRVSDVRLVTSMPRTASNKVMRRMLRKML